MPHFTTLIADGERPSRQRIRRLLAFKPECELIGECANGAEAVRVVEREKPDLVFLAVDMPGMDGFKVVGALTGARPLIIFTATCDEYALRAFEVGAFDYLLKPFDRRRFRESVQRACMRLAQERAGQPPGRDVARPADRVAVRNNGRVIFLKTAEIDWIEASDNYVCLHCGKDTHMMRETMSDLEQRLDPALFVRVHRSAIVNIDRIREMHPWFHGAHRIVLADGTELTMTKTHRDKLESRLLLG